MDPAVARFQNALLLEPRVKLSATVLTAADAGYFLPLQCLITSLRLSHDCAIRVVDLGLREAQRRWLRRQACELVRPPRLAMPRTRHFWQSWNKPLYFQASGKRPLLWLDADCIVTGSLSLVDDLLRDRPAIFTDTAAVHFCGWHDGTRSTANEQGLYELHPVPARFAAGDCPNAGVLALDPRRPRDATILSTWLEMVRRAQSDRRLAPLGAKSQDVHGLIRWHDQGALQWALEQLGERELVLADRRFNDPISAVGAKSLADLTGKLERLRQTRVVHFPSGSKPYGVFPRKCALEPRGYPENRRDLTLLVLGHGIRYQAPDASCLMPIHLPALDPNNDLAESRLFCSNVLAGVHTEFIGLCTQRWDEKYAGRCRPLAELHRLRMGLSIVWAAAPAEPGWLDYSERAHPGMRRVVTWLAARMGVSEVPRRSVWSNNLIAHHSVVRGLQEWVWRGLGLVRQEFGRWPRYGMKGADRSRYGSYLAERISMLYFCMRDDLDIRQISL